MNTRQTAIKFWLRFQIVKEQRKFPRNRDEEKITQFETILASPEIIEYMAQEPGLDEIKDAGDGTLLKLILEWIDNGGLDKVLEFILALIKAFA